LGKRPFTAAFADAADGIVQAIVAQPNFRIQVILGLAALVGAWILHLSTTSWLIVILAIGFVLAAELFNTCLEHFVDLVQPEAHPLARFTKHAGAAAVLTASVAAAAVGIIIYGQALARVLRHHG
jgi:diacylglycerol kinase (ATP)